jgi:hypothetical protein
VQADRPAAERGQLVDFALDLDARTLRRYATARSRHDRDLTRPIVHVVELNRQEGCADGARDDARHADPLVLVLVRTILELRNPDTTGGAAGDEQGAQERDGENPHGCIPTL